MNGLYGVFTTCPFIRLRCLLYSVIHLRCLLYSFILLRWPLYSSRSDCFSCCSYLNIFERVTHHGDQHVDEYNNNGDMVESEQKHSNSLDHRCRRVATWKTIHVRTPSLLGRVLDLNTVDIDKTEHGPKQWEQSSRQPKKTNSRLPCLYFRD